MTSNELNKYLVKKDTVLIVYDFHVNNKANPVVFSRGDYLYLYNWMVFSDKKELLGSITSSDFDEKNFILCNVDKEAGKMPYKEILYFFLIFAGIVAYALVDYLLKTYLQY